MKLLRRRINTFFALQAILLFMAGLRALLDTRYVERGVSPLRHWVFLSGYLLLSMVFTKAWRVTRKPNPFREAWAIAAAAISICTGLYLLWYAHATHTFPVSGLTVLLMGLGTIFLIVQARTPSQSRAPS
jgi:CHASE2 domain-containing sensor protein